MGNASASKSSTPTAVVRDSQNMEKHANKSSNKPQLKHAGSKLPPLHVVKDSSTQTHESGSKVNSIIVSIGTLFIVLSVVYFSVCYIIICSEYVQSLIVYSHYVKEDLPLQQLFKIGLPEGRNIEVITEDGVLLRGWHLMNPGPELTHANQLLEESDRNAYFDNTLAFTERVVVYFHGNSETRGQAFRLLKIKQLAVHLKAHVIAFDYRGFADSEGYPSEQGTHLDSRAVVHYIDNIVRRYNPQATGYLTQTFDKDSEALENAVADASGESDDMFSKLLGLLQLQQNNNTLPSDGYQVLNKTVAADTEVKAIETKNVRQPHLFLYGHSLGAAISTALAVEVSTLRPGALSGLILDCPFTVLADAMKDHPLTKPFRTFPQIFRAMVSSLQFKYSNIERIKLVNAPVLLMHGEQDIKILHSHSRELFLRATNTTQLPVTTSPGDYFGTNTKDVTVKQSFLGSLFGGTSGGGNTTISCQFPVEWHVIPQAGHNEVYATKKWLVLLPTFVQHSEDFARANRGACFV